MRSTSNGRNPLAWFCIFFGAALATLGVARYTLHGQAVYWPLLSTGLGVMCFALAFADALAVKAAGEAAGGVGSILGGLLAGIRGGPPPKVVTPEPAQTTVVNRPDAAPVVAPPEGAPFVAERRDTATPTTAATTAPTVHAQFRAPRPRNADGTFAPMKVEATAKGVTVDGRDPVTAEEIAAVVSWANARLAHTPPEVAAPVVSGPVAAGLAGRTPDA